ncbi:hypothetical protein vBEcoMWL3_gp075c [Escherichia phage vB_EcoM_WL-3]|nr:hypothetical protein vBEcoMWL3_gp075c [Escherichia phage vB_EcoM_WL-3]
MLNSKFIILTAKSLFLSGNTAIVWSNWGKYDLRY